VSTSAIDVPERRMRISNEEPTQSEYELGMLGKSVNYQIYGGTLVNPSSQSSTTVAGIVSSLSNTISVKAV
jgi:hypothetical protein